MSDVPTRLAVIPDSVARPPEHSLVTRFLEGFEVHRTAATELCLILLAIPAVAQVLAALTVSFSAGHGPGF